MNVPRHKIILVATVVALFLLAFPLIAITVFSLYAHGNVVAAWLTFFACGLSLALGTTFALARWLVWPLLELSSQVKRISNDPRLRTRIDLPRTGCGDVAAIGGAVNSFLDLLAEREEELHQANEALAASEWRYRNLFDRAFDVVFVLDCDGNILEMNDAGVKLLGYDSCDEIKRVAPQLFDERQAGSDRLIAMLAAKGHLREYEIPLRTKEGRELPGNLSVALLQEPNGKSTICGYFRDLTRQREMEQRIIHMKKMEVAATLADGLSHEFNTVLTTIIGYAELIAGKLPQSSPLHAHMAPLLRSARAGAYFTKNLLRYKREKALPSACFPLEALLAELREAMVRVGDNIEVTILSAPMESHISGDRHYLYQVFLNLFHNARDAMGTSGGALAVTSNLLYLTPQEARHHGCEPGRYVSVAVSDTGVGIDARNLSRIFEPFFTTKEVGKGTGLGLTMVYTIVKEHGGFITVASEKGKGTVFTVSLPACEPSVPARASLNASSS